MTLDRPADAPVTSTRQGGVLTLQLNRSDRRNALTGEMLAILGRELEDAVSQPDLRLVVLRAGGVDFCTGLDLDEVYRQADATAAQHQAESARITRVLQSLAACRAPTVAAVQGRALGIGATLAVGCDVTLAASNSQFGFPELTYGFLPAFATVLVSRVTGRKAAVDLLATGRIIRAEEACTLGLVSRVIPEEGFSAVVGSCLKGLCACAGELLMEFKAFHHRVEELPLEEALAVAAQVNARARTTAAFREAARQYLAMT